MRHQTSLRVVLVVLVSLAAVNGFSELHKDKTAGVTYDIPSWWKWEQREQGVVLATEDGSLVMMLWTPRGATLEDAIEKLDDELSGVIKGAKVNGKPQRGSLNGMETLSISGRGRVDGSRVEYSVIVVGAKRPLIVLGFGEIGKYEKHNDAILGFIKTIRRTK